ncbi:hypothetical protein AX14_001866 [Amanita brunnescens Koide BX004]|nr:hypothetical protein AX14_001866 [Amanita brunnescens Koide BX004]
MMDDDDEFLYGSSAAAPTEPAKARALSHSPPVATPVPQACVAPFIRAVLEV